MISFKQFLEDQDDRLKYLKKFPDAPEWSPKQAESNYRIGKVTFAAEGGLGSVPFNQSVYYHGFVAMMKPSVFMKLALPDEGQQEGTSKELEKLINDGYALGIPFLQISTQDLEDGKGPAKIKGHEGRGRMRAVMRINGDDPIPVHMFLTGGMRNRDLNSDIITDIADGVKSEDGKSIVRKPFDKVHLG